MKAKISRSLLHHPVEFNLSQVLAVRKAGDRSFSRTTYPQKLQHRIVEKDPPIGCTLPRMLSTRSFGQPQS